MLKKVKAHVTTKKKKEKGEKKWSARKIKIKSRNTHTRFHAVSMCKKKKKTTFCFKRTKIVFSNLNSYPPPFISE